jgi:hypothetical protein
VLQGRLRLAAPWSDHLSANARAALAALYCAQITAWLVARLWHGVPTQRSVVVEGPLAHNAVYLAVLQALMPQTRCLASHDAMEGTARGAWLLSRWGTAAAVQLEPVPVAALAGLADYQARWLAQLG